MRIEDKIIIRNRKDAAISRPGAMATDPPMSVRNNKIDLRIAPFPVNASRTKQIADNSFTDAKKPEALGKCGTGNTLIS